MLESLGQVLKEVMEALSPSKVGGILDWLAGSDRLLIMEILRDEEVSEGNSEGGRGVEASEDEGSVKAVDAPWPKEGGRGADK